MYVIFSIVVLFTWIYLMFVTPAPMKALYEVFKRHTKLAWVYISVMYAIVMGLMIWNVRLDSTRLTFLIYLIFELIIPVIICTYILTWEKRAIENRVPPGIDVLLARIKQKKKDLDS